MTDPGPPASHGPLRLEDGEAYVATLIRRDAADLLWSVKTASGNGLHRLAAHREAPSTRPTGNSHSTGARSATEPELGPSK